MTGMLPININGIDALNSIGENIIIADKNYKIVWLNSRARELFVSLAPLYNLKNADEVIGMNMDSFHAQPSHQRQIMAGVKDGHKARIHIKNQFVADIVITPIRNSNSQENGVEGYMVMLMDVTTQAEEERNMKEKIRELSAPILNIWDNTIAITLVGEFDMDRGETIIPAVLEECTTKGIEFVMVSFRGIKQFDESVRHTVLKLHASLKLLGVQCIVVGIRPQLAAGIGDLKNIATFRDAHEGLKYIMKLQENQ
jgi:anti-anti-sigma regulatory factor